MVVPSYSHPLALSAFKPSSSHSANIFCQYAAPMNHTFPESKRYRGQAGSCDQSSDDSIIIDKARACAIFTSRWRGARPAMKAGNASAGWVANRVLRRSTVHARKAVPAGRPGASPCRGGQLQSHSALGLLISPSRSAPEQSVMHRKP